MYIGWLYTKTGILIAFMVLFGVFLETWETYDEHGARGEARTVAEGVATHLAMVAGAAPEYSAGNGYSRSISLPREVHGAPYVLTIDGANYQVRVRLLGKYDDENIEATGFLPEAAVYMSDGSPAMDAPLEFMVTEQLREGIIGLRVTKTGGAEDYTLKIEGY